jgi:beta-glucosidase
MKQFPKNFFWGAATASYQVEGGINNTDWSLAAEEGLVPKCGDACDHYNRYEADFDIAKLLGHTAHRFSLEWARIEPEEGKFNGEAIQHYRMVLQALKDRGITPYVTLWHFTLPQWFAKDGGFERPDSAALFARYATFVVHQLGDLCDHFATMNEPNVYATHGWLYGAWPPFKRGKLPLYTISKEDGTSEKLGVPPSFLHVRQYFRVTKNLVRAHGMAYTHIKNICPAVKVGVVKHVHVFAANDTWYYKLTARVANYFQSTKFLDEIHDVCDEIGLNYYRYTQFGDTKNYLKTDMEWNAHPAGVYDALMLLKKYNKPVFIAEAGIADADDDMRADYIEQQVKAVWRALKHGVDVRGHFYWSLLDNYEWALGFEKRFGLVAVDFITQKRTIRASAHVYKKIIIDNGLLE